MWSERAERVVSQLIAQLPAEQLDPNRTHAARWKALHIGGSMWADYYLRPNGEVVIIGGDVDFPDVETVYTDRRRVLMALVWGSRCYPELRELLPQREPGSTDCVCRQHPNIFGPGKVICSECGGVGWLPAGQAGRGQQGEA
jgi:hypothetical protein